MGHFQNNPFQVNVWYSNDQILVTSKGEAVLKKNTCCHYEKKILLNLVR